MVPFLDHASAKSLDQAVMSVLILAEQGMGLKGLRRFLFVAKDFGGFVEIRLATIVAAHAEASINHRTRGHGIGYSERNPVPVKQILANMMEMIFAQHDPAILSIFPHWNLLDLVCRTISRCTRCVRSVFVQRHFDKSSPFQFGTHAQPQNRLATDRELRRGSLSTCPLTLTIRLAPLISLPFPADRSYGALF